jgi:hypothetical protein
LHAHVSFATDPLSTPSFKHAGHGTGSAQVSPLNPRAHEHSQFPEATDPMFCPPFKHTISHVAVVVLVVVVVVVVVGVVVVVMVVVSGVVVVFVVVVAVVDVVVVVVVVVVFRVVVVVVGVVVVMVVVVAVVIVVFGFGRRVGADTRVGRFVRVCFALPVVCHVVLSRVVVTIGALVGFVCAVRTGSVEALAVRAGTTVVRMAAAVVRAGRLIAVQVAPS